MQLLVKLFVKCRLVWPTLAALGWQQATGAHSSPLKHPERAGHGRRRFKAGCQGSISNVLAPSFFLLFFEKPTQVRPFSVWLNIDWFQRLQLGNLGFLACQGFRDAKATCFKVSKWSEGWESHFISQGSCPLASRVFFCFFANLPEPVDFEPSAFGSCSNEWNQSRKRSTCSRRVTQVRAGWLAHEIAGLACVEASRGKPLLCYNGPRHCMGLWGI